MLRPYMSVCGYRIFLDDEQNAMHVGGHDYESIQ
jgi:hypothetical protein